MKPQIANKVFDPVKLEAMTEPLFVRVEKKKGNTRQPIPLPAGENGEPQGSNFSKEDVRGLEQWLVNDWSGGGYYVITVSDSTSPVPQKHEWEMFYSPNDYPERVPPPLAAAVSERITMTPPTTTQVRPMAPSAFPNGLPAGMPMISGQPSMYYPAPQPTPVLIGGGVGSYGAQPQMPYGWQFDAERRQHEAQLAQLQAQLAKEREERQAAQHRQDLDRERTANMERFSKLEQLIAQLAQAQTQAIARPAVDPAIEGIKEQNRILQAQLENEKREREAERRESQLKEQMQRASEDARRQFEALQEQFQAAMQAQTQNKSLDPAIMMVIETVKQASSQAAMQMAEMRQFMMNPRDIMAMAKESSNGLDQATRAITNTYQDILQMQRQAVEQIMQLNNNGGSETIGLIREGMERAASFAERFVGGKVKEATVAQQSQAEMAKAQAMVMQAQAAHAQAQVQAQALAAQAAARAAAAAAAAPQGPGQAPAQPTPATVINGAPVGAKNANPPQAPAANGNGTETGVRRHLGRTDQEWFGLLLPKVHELRAGVERLMDSLKQTPHRLLPDGHVDGIEPEQAANAILQAGMAVVQQGLPVSAMHDLFGQGRIADLLDVLLPDAPQPYRDEVVQLVFKALEGGGDEDDDDDEEDDEPEDKAEAASAPSPVSLVPTPPRARA